MKVAVIGITTPSVPNWEKPENYGGYRFLPGAAALKKTLAELRSREHPDLVLAAVHAGLDRDPKTGVVTIGQMPGENMVYQLATEVPEIDAIIFGHTHSELPDYRIGKVLLVQPKNWAISLARLDFQMQKAANGHWTVAQKDSRLIPVKADTAADESILADRQAVSRDHGALSEYRRGRIGEGHGQHARAGGGHGADGCDPAGAALLCQGGCIFCFAVQPAGQRSKGTCNRTPDRSALCLRQRTVRDRGHGQDGERRAGKRRPLLSFLSGRELRQAAADESARHRIQLRYGRRRAVRNRPDAAGRRPDPEFDVEGAGRWSPDQKLRIAVNNYRAAGSAGYSMFVGAKILWQSMTEIRDLMIQYYTERKQLPVEPDNNWRIVPEQARQTLERQAAAEAKRAKLM